MLADGSAQKRLTQNERVDERPAWSPDNKWIAFSWRNRVDAGIIIRNLESGAEVILSPGTAYAYQRPDWSLDGKSIVCEWFQRSAK